MTVVTFLNFFSEFKAVPVQTLDAYLGVAQARVSANVFGTRADYAQSLMMAHMLTLQGFGGQGAAGGPVNNEAAGDLSRGYGTVGEAGSGDAEYRTTRYGIMYIELRNEVVVGLSTVGPSRSPTRPC